MLGFAIKVWNMLGGIDWAGLPVAAELFGVTDIDSLIHHLLLIRDQQAQAR